MIPFTTVRKCRKCKYKVAKGEIMRLALCIVITVRTEPIVGGMAKLPRVRFRILVGSSGMGRGHDEQTMLNGKGQERGKTWGTRRDEPFT